MTGKSDVRRYLMVAARVRRGEVVLSPEQQRQFQQMAEDVGPALKAVSDVSTKVKAAEAEQKNGERVLAELETRRHDAASISSVAIASVQGETQVRILVYAPAGGKPHHWTPRDIRTRLRGVQSGELLFLGGAGSVDWRSDVVPDGAPAAPPPSAA